MDTLLQQFPPISLSEMSSVKLMNRTDTKFLTTVSGLRQLLQMAQGDYYVQDIDGSRLAEYQTTYFDTCGHDMFYEHQHGHANRQKLRFRSYVNSNLLFMEVKTKNNHGRTKKKRIAVDNLDLQDTVKTDFLSTHLRYAAEPLIPAVRNHFRRITLVNRAKTERLTIDIDVRFHGMQTDCDCDMGPLVIIELKRDGLVPSPVLAMLRKLRIHPHGFSKYCFGLALTTPGLRLNRLKPKMVDVRKIINEQQTETIWNY